MKTLRIALTIIFATTILCYKGFSQCNSEELATASVASLTPGYNFLKSYKVSGEQDLEKMEFSYVLTKGTQYILNIKESNRTPATVVTLYDAKRNKIATNKLPGGIAQAIAFSCGATGIYYITYTFEGTAERCAGSSLGFKR